MSEFYFEERREHQDNVRRAVGIPVGLVGQVGPVVKVVQCRDGSLEVSIQRKFQVYGARNKS